MQAIATLNIIAVISDIYVDFKSHIYFLFPFLEKKKTYRICEFRTHNLIVGHGGGGVLQSARSFVSYGNA